MELIINFRICTILNSVKNENIFINQVNNKFNMVKLISKVLNLSNSYNYYKSNHELLKKQLDQLEAKKQDKLNLISIELKNLKKDLQENNNDLKRLHEIQNGIKITQNEIKGVYDNIQNEIKITHDENKRVYLNIQNEIYANRILQNLDIIKKESANRKINIVFIINFQISVMDGLIHLLNEDTFFNITVVVIPYDPHGLNLFDNGLSAYQLKDYNKNYEYFKEKGFNVIKGYDEKSQGLIDIEYDLRPDMVFYSTSWEFQLPEIFRMENLPKNILFCYVPYGIYAAQMQDDQFNREIHNKSWKTFSETKFHKQLSAKYSDTGSSNVVVTGYPKMDPLIDGSHTKNPYLWKDSSHRKKRIIWAPHHSIGWSSTAFSTFDKNYKFFYNYAKVHTEIEWVFKPHPALRHASIFFPEGQAGDFSVENLSKYYDSWENLPNATVHEGGDYFNLFATSDAMILDSVSFLSEYLYVGKPGLFLTRPDQKFNEFGEIIKNAWYQADGNDFKQIEMFINEVVVNEDDKLRNIREDIYSQYLDTGGITASSKIYSYIKGSITNESMED